MKIQIFIFHSYATRNEFISSKRSVLSSSLGSHKSKDTQ